MKNFVVSLLILVMAGCGVQYAGVSQGEHNTDLIDQLFGTVPVMPRVPVRRGNAALGVRAPFSDNVFTFEVMNQVQMYGQKPLIITELWVAGTRVPAVPMTKETGIFDNVFRVPFLRFGQSTYVNLPPCQMLDGSDECKVRVVAQAASWRYDLAGHKVRGPNVRCIEMVVDALGGIARLDWSHVMADKTITCPGQAMASR